MSLGLPSPLAAGVTAPTVPFVAIAGVDDAVALSAIVDDNAGEATNAHGNSATVHGAIEAGRDVADLILQL